MMSSCRGSRRPVSVERRQVRVERHTGRRSQQPRTSPLAASAATVSQVRQRMSFLFDPLKVGT